MITALVALLSGLVTTSVAAAEARDPDDGGRDALALAAGTRWTPPTTGLAVAANAGWIGAEGVSGAAGGVLVRGAWSPAPWLELGVEGGVEGWALDAGGYGAARTGLSTLLVSAGVGFVRGRASESVRLVVGVGPSAVGLDTIDASGREGMVGLRLDGAFLGDETELRILIDLGVVVRDAIAFAGAGQADVVLGRRASIVRLGAGFWERAGGDSLVFGAHGGVLVALGRATRLRVSVGLPMFGDDPFGRRLWLSAALVTLAR